MRGGPRPAAHRLTFSMVPGSRRSSRRHSTTPSLRDACRKPSGSATVFLGDSSTPSAMSHVTVCSAEFIAAAAAGRGGMGRDGQGRAGTGCAARRWAGWLHLGAAAARPAAPRASSCARPMDRQARPGPAQARRLARSGPARRGAARLGEARPVRPGRPPARQAPVREVPVDDITGEGEKEKEKKKRRDSRVRAPRPAPAPRALGRARPSPAVRPARPPSHLRGVGVPGRLPGAPEAGSPSRRRRPPAPPPRTPAGVRYARLRSGSRERPATHPPRRTRAPRSLARSLLRLGTGLGFYRGGSV